MNFFKKNAFLWLCLLIYIANVFPGILRGFSAITYDNGRDLLAAWRIFHERNLTLIGPTTGISGVFHGAWAFYWLIIPMLIAQWNPLGVPLAIAVSGLIGLVILYFLLKDIFDLKIAGFSSLVYAGSPFLIGHFTQLGHNNLIPFFIILSLVFLWRILKTNRAVNFFLFGLASGFLFEFEFAFGLFILPFNFTSCLLFIGSSKEKLKNKLIKLGYLVVGVFLPLSLRILFEIRNNFLMLRSLINNFFFPEIKFYAFRNLTLWEKLSRRLNFFYDFWQNLFSPLLSWLAIGSLIVSVILLPQIIKQEKDKRRTFIVYLLLLIIFEFTCFMYYRDVIWVNYLTGFSIYYLIVLSFVIKYLTKLNFGKTVLSILTTIIMAVSIAQVTVAELDKQNLSINDPSAMINQQKAISYIYADAGKTDFSVGIYSPSWFSFPYDYWFLWREQKKGIKTPHSLWQTRLNYLIVEPGNKDKTEKEWFEKFIDQKARLVSRKYFGDLTVEKWLL